MGNKKKNNSIISRHEVELLNKYYEIDDDNKVVTIPLHYNKASDLVNERIIAKDNYLFNYEELSSINDMIQRIPSMYKININIEIDDYENYESEKLLSGFNDAMELNQFNSIRENKWKYLKAGILLIIGITVLCVVGYANLNHWFGSTERADVYSEIFDIIGWVFIWEPVTIAFLTTSDLPFQSNLFKKRVLNVCFSDTKNVLASEDLSTKSNKWESEKTLEILSRWALLIAGVGLIASGAIISVKNVSDLYRLIVGTLEGSKSSNIGLISMDLLANVIQILGGIASLFRYMGKRVLRIYSYAFAGVLLAISALILILNITDPKTIVSTLITLIITFLYLFGLVANIIVNKNKKILE